MKACHTRRQRNIFSWLGEVGDAPNDGLGSLLCNEFREGGMVCEHVQRLSDSAVHSVAREGNYRGGTGQANAHGNVNMLGTNAFQPSRDRLGSKQN